MAPSLVARWNHPGLGIRSWRFHLRGQYDLWSGQPLHPDLECPICSSTQYRFSESPLRLHYFFFLQESADDHQNGLPSPNCQKKNLWNQVNNRSKGFKFNWIQFPSVLLKFPGTWTLKSHQQSPNFQVQRSLQAASTPHFLPSTAPQQLPSLHTSVSTS